MLGPFATASRRTPPVLHCHLPSVATVARRLRIDVHNNINDNNDNSDNAWQRGPLLPHGMGPIKTVIDDSSRNHIPQKIAVEIELSTGNRSFTQMYILKTVLLQIHPSLFIKGTLLTLWRRKQQVQLQHINRFRKAEAKLTYMYMYVHRKDRRLLPTSP